MGYEDDGPTGPGDVAHLPETFVLKRHVANCQNFVEHKYLRFQMRRHRERQPHVHATAVALYRRVDELLDLRERHDLIEFAAYLGLRHAEDGAIEKHVLAAAQLRMK